MALTEIKTSGIADDAITLAKQAAGTDGQIITYDASGNPVAVGPGTDGQVLTSTGAGSPPAFENVSGGGGGTTNLSATANGTSLTVESSSGDNVSLPAATTSAWGVMTDEDKTKLDGIETSATADQTAAEIRTLVESASDSNVFTDDDHSKLDGIAASANNYTHPSVNHIPAGGSSGQVLKYSSSGTAAWGTDNDTTYSTVSTSAAGLAPQLPGSHGGKFLKADGTWEVPPDTDTNTTYSVGDGGLTQKNFTTTLKDKLDGIAASANNYVHPNHSGDVTSSADGATTIADNAVTLAKMAGLARGKIIYGDTNGDPAALAPGSANQVLTSDGQDISWAAASGGGGGSGDYVHISTTSITSSVGSVEITLPTGYDRFEFMFDFYSSGRAHVYFSFSEDDGSNYLVNAYKVSSQHGSYTYSLTSTSTNYNGPVMVDRVKYAVGSIQIFRASETSDTRFISYCSGFDGGSYPGSVQTAGGMSTAQTARINKVKMYATGSYTFDSGKIILYGIEDS